jgi:hypothetical protein
MKRETPPARPGASVEDWAAAVSRALARARAARQHGRIVIELFDGEVRRLEIHQSAIDPRAVAPEED